MSFSYANAKKMRKRTKREQLSMELSIQKQMVNRLASALVLAKNVLDRFGESAKWLSEEEFDELGNVTHTNYIWSGEEDPTKQIAAAIEQIKEKLGPLSGMFEPRPVVKEQPATEPDSSSPPPHQS